MPGSMCFLHEATGHLPPRSNIVVSRVTCTLTVYTDNFLERGMMLCSECGLGGDERGRVCEAKFLTTPYKSIFQINMLKYQFGQKIRQVTHVLDSGLHLEGVEKF